MRVHRSLGMIVGILDTFQDVSLKGLIGIGEFFDAFISSIHIL